MPSKSDPSGTNPIINPVIKTIDARFAKLRSDIREAFKNDQFGLGSGNPLFLVNASESEIAAAFTIWLRSLVDQGFLEIDIATGRVTLLDAALTTAFLQGSQRGAQEILAGTQPDLNLSVIGSGATTDQLRLIFQSVDSSLAQVGQQLVNSMSNTLARGLIAGLNPSEIAATIVQDTKLPQARARTIARTEIQRAHHMGNVAELEAANIEGVTVVAEFSTAKDGNVCQDCARLEGRIFTIDEIRGIIPLHPNCRCVALPVIPDVSEVDGKPTKQQLEEIVSPDALTDEGNLKKDRGFFEELSGEKNPPNFDVEDAVKRQEKENRDLALLLSANAAKLDKKLNTIDNTTDQKMVGLIDSLLNYQEKQTEVSNTILTNNIIEEVGRQFPAGKDGLSVQGNKGDKGGTGISIKGNKGERGHKGDSIKGDKGDKGDSIKGDSGISVQGKKGERGDKGDKGSIPDHLLVTNKNDKVIGIKFEKPDGTYSDVINFKSQLKVNNVQNLELKGKRIRFLVNAKWTKWLDFSGGGSGGGIGEAPEDGKTYGRKDGEWIEVSHPSATWGSITGTLSDQTDLQNALDAKQDDLDGLAIPTAVVTVTDKVLIQDTDDADNLKTATVQSIIDLAPQGDFVGPASATNNAVVLFDGITGKLGKNSPVIVDGSANVTGINDLTVGNDLQIDNDANIDGNATIPTGELTIKDILTYYTLAHTGGTGIINGGGILTIDVDPTKFSISAGEGYIINTFTTPSNPLITPVSWNAFAGLDPVNISSTNNLSWIAIDINGDVFQSATEFTIEQHRDYIVLGVIVHPGGAVNQSTTDQSNSMDNYLAHDTTDALGNINMYGNNFNPAATDLTLRKEAGQSFLVNANRDANSKNPNFKIDPVDSPLTFLYVYNDGSGGITTVLSQTDVDPNFYDDGSGVLQAVSNNRWTNQQCYFFPSSNIKIVRYGTEVFLSKALALAANNEIPLTIGTGLDPELVRSVLSIEKGASDLTSAEAVFSSTGKFGLGGGGGGTSGSGTFQDLQDTYENSITPEITTDATRGALTVKIGSGADTDDAIDVLNTAGTSVFDITGEGDVTATGDLTADIIYPTQLREAKGADIASAAALALGVDGNSFDVTGTTAITSINTLAVGTIATLHFDGILTLTHHATDLILPTGANIITAVGDIAMFWEYATGDWRCISYTRASGEALVGGGGGGVPTNTFYGYDSTITKADPTAGKFRLNSATMASVTEMYVDDLDGRGVDMSSWIEKFSVNEHIYFGQTDDETAGALFIVTVAAVDETGYYTVGLTHVGDGTSGFTNAKDYGLQFQGGDTVTQTVKSAKQSVVTMSATQTTDLAIDDPIQFDTITGDYTLGTYKIKVLAGEVATLSANIFLKLSLLGANSDLQWYDVTNTAYVGEPMTYHPSGNGSFLTSGGQPIAYLATPLVDTEYELRVESNGTGTVTEVRTQSTVSVIGYEEIEVGVGVGEEIFDIKSAKSAELTLSAQSSLTAGSPIEFDTIVGDYTLDTYRIMIPAGEVCVLSVNPEYRVGSSGSDFTLQWYDATALAYVGETSIYNASTNAGNNDSVDTPCSHRVNPSVDTEYECRIKAVSGTITTLQTRTTGIAIGYENIEVAGNGVSHDVKSAKLASATLSGDQSTSLGLDDPLQFDTIDGDYTMDAANFRFQVPAGDRVILTANLELALSASTATNDLQWYDVTAGAYIGKAVGIFRLDRTPTTVTPQQPITVEVNPSVDSEYELRIKTLTSGTITLVKEESTVSVIGYETVTANVVGKSIMPRLVEITSTSNYVKPSNLVGLKVWNTGGGGGGGGTTSVGTFDCGAGGGGGGTSMKYIPASQLSASETMTIGAAGTAGSSSGGAGGVGGTTSFGAHNSATGGAGGLGNVNNGDPTVGGSGSGGDCNHDGGMGNAGYQYNGNSMGGAGGSTIWGGGGGSPTCYSSTTRAGASGKAYGSGGSGACSGNGTNQAGGAGKQGVIIYEEVF